MAGHPLRSATDRRLGRPLPHQLPNQTRVHLIPPEFFPLSHAALWSYAVLAVISNCYPPVRGRLPTRYSPVRHSVTRIFIRRIKSRCFVRLACVKHAASVHPEPGSNSRWYMFLAASLLSNIIVLQLCWRTTPFVPSQESLGNSVPVYCSGLTSFDVRSWKISLKNFQGLLSIVQLSMFFFVVAVSCDSFYIISKRFMFVNNFFISFLLLWSSSSRDSFNRIPYPSKLVNSFFLCPLRDPCMPLLSLCLDQRTNVILSRLSRIVNVVFIFCAIQNILTLVQPSV